jgi:hypothetical protein
MIDELEAVVEFVGRNGNRDFVDCVISYDDDNKRIVSTYIAESDAIFNMPKKWHKPSDRAGYLLASEHFLKANRRELQDAVNFA